MYFNKPIFSDKPNKVESMEMACEAAKIKQEFKQVYTLRDKYFPYVESFLPKTEHVLFKYIAKYEDKNSALLNSPYPTKQLLFSETGEDANIIFKCIHVDRYELMDDIKAVPLPPSMKNKQKASFQPIQVALYLIIRYYLITNQLDKMKVIYRYYGYSLYWKMFSKYWRGGVFREEAMIYTVNNMSYRFILKKEGSVGKLINYVIENRYDHYRSEIIGSADEEIRYVLDACQSDMNAKLKEIYGYYKDNYKAGNVMYEGNSMLDNQGTQREDISISSVAESLAQRYTNIFCMSSIDVIKINQILLLVKEISKKELQNTLEYILRDASSDDIQSLYSSIFYLYLSNDNPNCNRDSIQSKLFLVTMFDVIKKGNSIDKNIVKIREIVDKWLNVGSNTFRLTQREATKTNYRKAVYCYFILCVSMNK